MNNKNNNISRKSDYDKRWTLTYVKFHHFIWPRINGVVVFPNKSGQRFRVEDFGPVWQSIALSILQNTSLLKPTIVLNYSTYLLVEMNI